MPKTKTKPRKAKSHKLPKRTDVPLQDQWDLTLLYASDAAWEKDFEKWQKQIDTFATFKGKLATSAKTIADLMRFDADFGRLGERLGNYASLKASGDQGDSTYQRMVGRFHHVVVKATEAASFMSPELLAIPQEKMDAFLNDREMTPWKLALERIVRYRPHTLSQDQEHLLAMTGHMADAPSAIFRQLTDTDFKWPTMKDEKGAEVELGHSSFSKFLHSPKRDVRKKAFELYYSQYQTFEHTLAASYNAAVQRDAFFAKARKYPTAREGTLFADNVPVSVYDALVEAVHRHLPTNHRYLALRGRALKIPDVHMYDTYVPMVAGIEKHHTWEQASHAVCEALQPLGDDYCKTLREGLLVKGPGRWADRYPNAGKRSGAFSSGGFDGPPYILMNYQPEVLDHVFTLAHEAGHSMHTWYSKKNQPFQYYGYTIFVAEVASTFNEQLLLRYMLDRADSKKERAYLINHAIDEIRGTLIRQTMFAEFEKVCHALVEAGEPLTIELARCQYRKLLEHYFGVPAESGEKKGPVSKFVIDKVLELEGLRIPHFYGAFYVYKYATGLSAAIALSQRVLNGGKRELNDYLNFLKGGCSKWPLDLLRDAGVDLEKPEPVDAALARFGELLTQLEELI